jgi:hypothetical protein
MFIANSISNHKERSCLYKFVSKEGLLCACLTIWRLTAGIWCRVDVAESAEWAIARNLDLDFFYNANMLIRIQNPSKYRKRSINEATNAPKAHNIQSDLLHISIIKFSFLYSIFIPCTATMLLLPFISIISPHSDIIQQRSCSQKFLREKDLCCLCTSLDVDFYVCKFKIVSEFY